MSWRDDPPRPLREPSPAPWGRILDLGATGVGAVLILAFLASAVVLAVAHPFRWEWGPGD